MRAFFSELRRRNVYKVGAAYAVVGWILIEAGSVLIPTFGGPEWVFRIFALAVLLGFPLALVLAWAFELTPEGLMRTDDVPLERSTTARTGRRFDFVIIGLLVVALAISVTLNLRDDSDAPEASIAVLPFTSGSTDPAQMMFVDGMHDELLTTLARIGSLKVISRTSVMEYRDSPKNLRQIGKELGVGAILEGAVQRAGDQVRINVQLIDAVRDSHLWGNTFDRRLTADNLFSIQSEIATTIADKLKATLTPDEKERLARPPTANLEAYNSYLAGRQNLYLRTLESLTRARRLFEQAISLDPDFALAYAGLSDSLMLLLINHDALTADEAFERSGDLLDKAMSLDADNADIFASLGLLKTSIWNLSQRDEDAEAAEAAFQRAIALNPNHTQALAWRAGLEADLGNHEQAIALYRRALELDPLARVTRLNLGENYASIGENDKALETWLGAHRLHPEWPTALDRISVHLFDLGRLDEALAWSYAAKAVQGADWRSGAYGMILSRLAFGQRDRAVEIIDEMPEDDPVSVLANAFALGIKGDLAGGYALLDRALGRIEYAQPPFLSLAAELAMQDGDFEAARAHLERLCPGFAAAEPHVDSLNCRNGVDYAYTLENLGETRRARKVLEATLHSLDARPRLGIAGYGITDVHALALLGEPEKALARLREAVDAGWRTPWNRDNWDLADDLFLSTLKDDARFQALVAEVEADIARMRERAAQAEASGDWSPLLAIAERGTGSQSGAASSR